MDPCYKLISISIFTTNYSEIISHEFIYGNTLKFIIEFILNSNYFKFNKLSNKINHGNSYFYYEKKSHLLECYLILILNILKHSFSSFYYKLDKIKYKFQEYMINLFQFLKQSNSLINNDINFYDHQFLIESSSRAMFNIFMTCRYLFEMNVIRDKSFFHLDKINFKFLNQSLQSKFLDNKEFVSCYFSNNELLELFILLTKNQLNNNLLGQILPTIFQYSQSKWRERIQIFAYQLIFCLLSDNQTKENLRNNKKLMKQLYFIQNRNIPLEIKYLRQNIYYKMKNRKLRNDYQIVISCHHSIDKEILQNIINIIENKTKTKNFLILNSKSKKFFFFRYFYNF